MKTRFILFSLILLLSGCKKIPSTLIIVSKDSHHNIEKWLTSIDPTLTVREFYFVSKDSPEFFLSAADGIVIGGGEDVHPALYGKPMYVELCGETDISRDSIETILIRHALQNAIPILGICRGQQIINAVEGGTLIPDLPTFNPGPIQHRNKSDSAHQVIAEPGSWLAEMTGRDAFWVNSRHHQAVDDVSDNFTISAYSTDSIIESIEIRKDLDHPFAVAVQWHPENQYNLLSDRIGKLFIQTARDP